MHKIKIFEFKNSTWVHVKDEEISESEYVEALQSYIQKKPVDGFYKIEIVKDENVSATLLTVNPFIFDQKEVYY